MTTRRDLLMRTAALAGAGLLSGCSGGGADDYAAAVRSTWRHTEDSSNRLPELQHDLVRYATLAPSSHNSQCWKFRLGGESISILPDPSRRCPAVDPDDHHLYVSLGCAAENLVQAAQAKGFRAEVGFDAQADAVRMRLAKASPVRSLLFEAIPRRQSTRAEYDGKAVPIEHLKMLGRAGQGNGVEVLLITAREHLEQILEYVTRGNAAQMGDAAFLEELKAWIRFSESEALATRDGLFAAASGNPAVPRWLGTRLMPLFFTAANENDRYAKHLHSSAGIAVFVSAVNDKAHWVEVGRCYERFALQATALGLRNAMLNQPLEVPALREQFSAYLGIGARRPDLVVRFGYGPEMPRSLRRPVEQVFV